MDAQDSDSSSPPGIQGKALVVEDDSLVLEFLAEVLALMGFSVDKAPNGLVGLDRIRSQQYSVIISDIRMPHMSGCELYLQAEKTRPGIEDRFVFTTGLIHGLTPYEYMIVSQRPCILKPAGVEEIQKVVRSVIGA
jgi:CheY-like chemotaxis protein